MTIRFLVFGTLDIRTDKGDDLNSVLAYSKHTALLAYLVLGNGGSHSRDRLTALLWPDLDDVRARNALSKAIHNLRRTLGDDLLVARGNQSIAINPAIIWCDAPAFDVAIADGRYQEALELYRRGELLEGFIVGDSNGFEHWLETARLRFREKAVKAADLLAEQAEGKGDFAASARWARVACDLSPHNETSLRRLLDRLTRLGDRAGALEAYNAFAARLARDLELEPSNETRDFAESLRAVSPVRTPPAIPRKREIGGESHAVREANIPALTVRDQSETRIALRTRTAIAGATGIIAIVVAATLFVRSRSDNPDLVAVSLLRNQTGNLALNPLADMATGGIVQDLTQAGQGVVDLRSAAERERRDGSNGGMESRSRARSAGADRMVDGDMYRRGDSLVVQMKIVDSKTGQVMHHLDPVAVPVTNAHTILDKLRDGVTGAVASLADTLYLPWTLAHSRPPRYAAFQEFMQGLDAIVNQGARPAVAHLKKAIALDTGFVEAKIWLLEQADLFPEERALVDSVKKVALAQRPTLAPFDQISLDRELAFLEGRLEMTYTTSRRLVAMAPTTPDAQVYLAQAAMATRRYGEAIEVLHRIDRTKGWLKNLGQITFWDLQAHRLNGDLAGALKEWRKARAEKPADFATCNSGILILSTMGREPQVDSLMRECAGLSTAPPTPDRAWELAGRGFRSGGHMTASRRAFERSLAIRAEAAVRDPQRRKALAAIQCELGLWKDAYESLRAVADTASDSDWTTLGVVAAHVGDNATVEKSLRRISAWGKKSNTRGVAKMSRAFVVLAMGNRKEAIALLRDARLEGAAPAWMSWYVRFELQPLRGDPRFEELIRPQT